MNFVWLVLALPLLGAIINGLFGRHYSKRLVGLIGCTSIFFSFAISVWTLLELTQATRKSFTQTLFNWISIGDLTVNLTLLIDPLTVVMMLVITGVGFLIHVFSVGYMGHDPNYHRYFSWLNLFSFSMLLLVMASNFLVLFVGWELVGLCSYFLIGFWFTKPSAAAAASKAFIVNRIGDFGFILGIFFIFITFGSLNYSNVFGFAQNALQFDPTLATTITLLLFVGAVGKSAQIPLYTWLPDAMEGPTPVSALIHAATMVTAGVYMVARTHALFEFAPFSMEIVAIIGAATAILAASIALANNDIKRVLAYSTVSQLGYMFLATGVGAFALAIFHLVSHAFMKALLFLGSGSVMHAMADETDMRKMGGLRKKIPWTWAVFLVGVVAMAGIPPLVGFFSKDLILEEVFFSGSTLLWGVGLFTAMLTAFYLLRAHFMTFSGQPRYDEKQIHPHESPPVMLWPLRILALLSIGGGALWISVLGFSFKPLEEFLAPVFDDVHHVAPDHQTALFDANTLMLISVLVALVGIVAAYLAYVRGYRFPSVIRTIFRPIHWLLAGKYFVDEVYDAIMVKPLRAISGFLASIFDLRLLDGLINGIGSLINWAGGALRSLQGGYIRSYAAWVLLGTLGILIYLLVR